ncbi:MAG: rhomboid family intramembrane serine protease [Alphaproteobacteria bacterium]|jgi:membrane associated rhomboid family serine protease|nr:rhomboid family intramembrane serine protease [Alphaproteobacteria bacterium]
MLGPKAPWDESNEPILRSPRVVIAFIIVFALVHIGSQFLSARQYDYLIENYALIPSHIAAGAASFWQTLQLGSQFVTYAFLHGDFTHLIFNSVWFLIFATAVARRAGTARFLTLMLLTTLGAALTHLTFHWGEPQPVVGASGAVSGLMGAAFRFIFVNPHAQLTWPPARLPLFSQPVLVTSTVWVVLNVLLGVTGYTPEGFGAAIAWEAHLGGFFTGLLLFPLFDRRRSWIS